jgi:iron complex outermembrane receptor protein
MLEPRSLVVRVLIVLSIVACPCFATIATSDEPAQSEPVGSELREKVTVAAENEEIMIGPRGASTSVVDPRATGGMPGTLNDLVSALPGVSENGQGGLFQVFSIRGVSRHRVTNMLAGMRLTSERRAGVSVSFIDPLLMGSVQVLRGPATTFYGSGALGGVVQVVPRDFAAPHAEAAYAGNGNERFIAAGVGGAQWSAGLAWRKADDAEAADGTLLNSHFERLSAVAQTNWKRGDWRYEFQAIPSLAEDIGKASSDYPQRTTNYPRQRHGLMRFAVTAPAEWRLQAYVHARDLRTEVVEAGVSRSRVENDSFDFGLRWEDEREVDSRITLQYGAESFNRRSVDSLERREDLDPVDPDEPLTLRTLDGGRLDELGAFGAVSWSWGATQWQAGVRYSWAEQANADAVEQTRSAWNGFAELTWQAGERLELRGSLDNGTRFPSLSELYFSGTTGAGGVIGNPELDSEQALNAELSARWLGRRLFLGGVLFHNTIDDYIERVEIAEDLLTWVNLTSGTIRGMELQAVWMLDESWRVFGSGHVMRGRDENDRPLADIPPHQLQVGTRRDKGRWDFHTRLAYRAEKDDPGSREQEISSAWLLDVTLAYAVSSRWKVALSGLNLLDEVYFPAADRKAALAPGRTIALRLSWAGG